ncbi:MAG: hypothetical protein ACFE0I_16020 [Elainellaceae cyanobacterium]
MPRKKRTSPVLNKSELRAVAIQSIDLKLDMGNGLSLDNYNSKISHLRTLLSDYNMALSKLDSLINDVEAAEKELKDMSELMLMGIATTYGKNSNEYEMAGGKRKSERKRPVRSQPAAAQPAAAA